MGKKEVEIYSLGSPKALAQFLYQRLSLPFFGDVGEQLSESTQANNTAFKHGSQNSKDVNISPQSVKATRHNLSVACRVLHSVDKFSVDRGCK